MSLKTIELQVALPRTFEAGKLSEQIQQRGQHANDLASIEVEKKREHDKSSILNMTQKDKAFLKKDPSHSQSDLSDHSNKDRREEKEETEIHPYKGITIDYSG